MNSDYNCLWRLFAVGKVNTRYIFPWWFPDKTLTAVAGTSAKLIGYPQRISNIFKVLTSFVWIFNSAFKFFIRMAMNCRNMRIFYYVDWFKPSQTHPDTHACLRKCLTMDLLRDLFCKNNLHSNRFYHMSYADCWNSNFHNLNSSNTLHYQSIVDVHSRLYSGHCKQNILAGKRKFHMSFHIQKWNNYCMVAKLHQDDSLENLIMKFKFKFKVKLDKNYSDTSQSEHIRQI